MFFTDVIQSDNPPSSSRAHRSMIHFLFFSHFPPRYRSSRLCKGQGTKPILHLKVNCISLLATTPHLQQRPFSDLTSRSIQTLVSSYIYTKHKNTTTKNILRTQKYDHTNHCLSYLPCSQSIYFSFAFIEFNILDFL